MTNKQEWQPIATAPRRTAILTWTEGISVRPMIAYSMGGKWFGATFESGKGTEIYEPTYWMPLPEPPEVD